MEQMGDNDSSRPETHTILKKISSKISALKEDIADIVRERSSPMPMRYQTSSDVSNVSFTLHDDTHSVVSDTTQTIDLQDSASIASTDSMTSTKSSTSVLQGELPCYSIRQLVLNVGFVGKNPSISHPSTPLKSSSASLASSTVSTPYSTVTSSSSAQEFYANGGIQLEQAGSDVTSDATEELYQKKNGNVEMTAGSSTSLGVFGDNELGSSMTLPEPKFILAVRETSRERFQFFSKTVSSRLVAVGLICFMLAFWAPASSYFSGLFVGITSAVTFCYISIHIYLHMNTPEGIADEWVEFPALESLLSKHCAEDKNTDIMVSGASVAFQCYDADNDDDFIRYPCDLHLDGYRLTVQLLNRTRSEDRKSDKEAKFLGYREYLLKEARIILVPEATLTRTKYWLNEYPIVIENLELLDKQIYNRQQFEKSKLDTHDFFTNTATILSIWFGTCPQKEEWFHKLSLVLRNENENLERGNSCLQDRSIHLSPSTHNSSLGLRPAPTNRNSQSVSIEEPTSSCVAPAKMQANNGESLNGSAVAESKVNGFNTRTACPAASQSSEKKMPNDVRLRKVLQSPECLDDLAITVNIMIRRLFHDVCQIQLFKQFVKTSIEQKLKEFSISILEHIRFDLVELGTNCPVVLKVEPLLWNPQGIGFSLFVYYHGSVKMSLRTRILLQRLTGSEAEKHKLMSAEHHSSQTTDKSNGNDFSSEQKLSEEEFKIPVVQKINEMLAAIGSNEYFQKFANIRIVKKLLDKISEKEIGVDIDITRISGTIKFHMASSPSDRIWIGFSELPEINIKVMPTYGNLYCSCALLENLLASRIRMAFRNLFVLPAMDDQLIPFLRDWVADIV